MARRDLKSTESMSNGKVDNGFLKGQEQAEAEPTWES